MESTSVTLSLFAGARERGPVGERMRGPLRLDGGRSRSRKIRFLLTRPHHRRRRLQGFDCSSFKLRESEAQIAFKVMLERQHSCM